LPHIDVPLILCCLASPAALYRSARGISLFSAGRRSLCSLATCHLRNAHDCIGGTLQAVCEARAAPVSNVSVCASI